TDNPPTNEIDGFDAGFVTSYQVATPLEFSTLYYWKIVPYNFVGDATPCPVWSFTTRPENMVTIGDGADINQSLPIEPYYGYSYSQSIYYPEEFGAAGFINSLSYHYNGAGVLETSTQWVIYMGLTDVDTFDSTSSWIPLDQLTMVYNDTITPPTGDEWINFSLDNMFFYDGMSNLVIAVEENEPDYGNWDEAFYCTPVTGARSIFFYSDGTDPDPAAPPTAYDTPAFIPNARFFMIPPSVGPYVILSALEIDFNVENINGTSDAYNLRIANFGQSDAVINPASVISGADADQFTLTDNNTYPITIPQFGEVSLDVYFHPTSQGHKEAILTIVDNVTDDDRETHQIPLHGYAYVPDGNNTSFTATEVSLDVEALQAIIEPEIDIDWYVFWQTGPAMIDAHTENLYNSNIDLAAFLYGPYNDLGTPVDEGAAIAFDDDSWPDGINPHLTANVTESGFYYLRIAGFDNSPADERMAKKHRRNLRWETNDYSLWISTDNHTPPPALDPPTNLEAEVTYQGVNLTWSLPEPDTRNLSGYNVYRDDVVINGSPVTSLFYLDSIDNLTVNQTYEYKVSALYTGPTGESVPCDSINITFTSVDPPVIAEGFDTYDNFVTQFGSWTILDEDEEETYGFNNGIDFPGENDAMAFIVFNPTATTPPLQFANAYSGTKYAACFSADTGINDDWLITPQIQLTQNPASIRLLARSYTVQFGMEKFEVAVSSGSTNPNSFTVISGEQPVEVPLAWTPYNFSLNAYAGQIVRVAIHCVSQQTFFMMLDDVMVVNNGATVGNPNNPLIPEVTALGTNYPNPFNPETVISFDLKERADVTLDIYNIKGQKVATIADDSFNAGRHSVIWKGTDSHGSSVSSGVYFYKMSCGTYTKTRKMILMK
ncbi:MAG: choice-of-anchor J domain-containing protein, partial [Candidatus Cloacimonetes bacterium]|nr:choice-of-anchor J domain-containing protein [Candidatus Cloacimonadota bacterium]